jgi:hypothetical protein
VCRASLISLCLALSLGAFACGQPALVRGPTCAEAFPAVAEWAAGKDRKTDVYFIECDGEIRGPALEPVSQEDRTATCEATGCFRLILERANGRLEELSILGQSSNVMRVQSGLLVYRVTWARSWAKWVVSNLDLITRS